MGDGANSAAAGDEIHLRGSPRRAVATSTFGFFVGFAGVVVYGPVATELEGAMGLSGLLLGLLVAAPQLTGSLLRIPFAAWVEDVGAKKPFTVLLGLSVVGMGGLLVILLTTYPNGLTMAHYPLIFGFGALSGCGIATFSVGIADTSYWYRSERRGTMLALFGGLGNTSPGLFTLVVPVALVHLGLTGTYVAWFALLLVGTIVFATVAVDAPYFQYRKGGLDAAEARARARADGQELFPGGDALAAIREAASLPRAWALTALFFVSFGGFLALTVWYPSYWNALHGFDIRTAGTITALAFTLPSALVRAGGGALSDRFGGEATAIASFATVAVAAGVLVVARDPHLALAATAALAAGMGVASAAVFQLLPAYVPEAVGGASGLVGGLGAFGGFLVPPVLGLFVDFRGATGYATGFVVYLVLGIVALGVASALYRSGEAASPADAPAVADD